jgi:protein DGCR14
MATPIILDEDTYTDAISFIIERDFYPNLAKVKAQKNYLEAQQSGGLADLTQAGKALHDLENKKSKSHRPFILMTVTNTCYLIAQKNENSQVNFYFEDEPSLEKRVNLTLSLDQFQTLYTR